MKIKNRLVLSFILFLLCFNNMQAQTKLSYTIEYDIAQITNYSFLEKLDSIITLTQFSDTTFIWGYDITPKDSLEFSPRLMNKKFRYKEVYILDTIIAPVFFAELQKKASAVDILKKSEFIIMIIGRRRLLFSKDKYYYVGYKGHNFLFSQNFKGITRLKNKKKKFKQRLFEFDLLPRPEWIIKYKNGELELIQFYINNDSE